MTDCFERPRFYFAPGSSSLAPHVSLLEADADFEAIPVILAAGEQKSPRYLGINPAGRVPALVVEGCLVTEVIGILTWVAHQYPEAKLLPIDDPVMLAAAYSKMSWYATSLHVALAQVYRTERFATDESVWPSLQAAGAANLEKGFDLIEKDLSGPWILGHEYSVLDPYTLVLWRWAERLKLDLSRYPKWRDHADRMFRRPSVISAVAAEQAAAERGASMVPA